MILIDGFARVLDHRIPGFPKRASPCRWRSSSAVLLFALTVYLLAENARAFVSQLIGYGPKLQALISSTAAQLGVAVPPTLGELIDRLNPTRFMGFAAQRLQNIALDAVFILIYLGFLLASRMGFKRKIVTLFPTRDEREDAVEIFERIRDRDRALRLGADRHRPDDRRSPWAC